MVDSREDAAEERFGDAEEDAMACLGAFPTKVKVVEDAAEETLLLWAFRNPVSIKQHVYVSQGSLELQLDACGQVLHIMQAPSSVNMLGVTGGVMWDSGVVLAKLLEHAVDTQGLQLRGKKCVEIGAGCGLTGCVTALLGATVIMTDMSDRLRLLQKNVDENSYSLSKSHGSACVRGLLWGDQPDQEIVDPLPDFVLASDVIYNENVVPQLLHTLRSLTGSDTTVLLSGELRNDAVLECFFRLALEDFTIGRVLEADLHPDYCNPRVAVYVLVRKTETRLIDDNPWTRRDSS
ncbi:uncharacterized protein [Physcomitrium patens]|uniref:Uncharacterized protein n=3 Tax=Physcomitrium patens TaxID=3218 RepID=A0A2K1JYU8_PHYPA|nr:protein N-lysine methyltransferase METTL21A-like isoform X1 [Physcomitrium patens]PNR46703.1 hypothetical protein PHYPA_013823 [Physcomitrium patens]|eukprot:XP_024387290.1 protein N-lysine methyltransferase METTL21A-like isoform X1 [Physcomitrella patens]